MGAVTDQLFYFDPADYDGAGIQSSAGNGAANIVGPHQKIDGTNFSFISFSDYRGAARLDLPAAGEYTYTAVLRLNAVFNTSSYLHLLTKDDNQLDYLIKRITANGSTASIEAGELYHYYQGTAGSEGCSVIPPMSKWMLLVIRAKSGVLTVSVTTDEGEAGAAVNKGAGIPTATTLAAGTYSIGAPSTRSQSDEGFPFDLGPFGFFDREITEQEELDLFKAIFYPTDDQGAAQASKVSGIVQIDGTPARRTVRAFGYTPTVHDLDGSTVNLSKSLGHATSDPDTGEYTIDLLAGYGREIFVVAFDDYGKDFKPDLSMTVGDRVHPTIPNGHVFECTSSGSLPAEEPAWVVDTETSQSYGTASMIARPFYRPMVHGPVVPEVTGFAAIDPNFSNVSLLLHMNGENDSPLFVDSSDNSVTISAFGNARIDTSQSKFGGSSAVFDGEGAFLAGDTGDNLLTYFGNSDFTIEFYAREDFDEGIVGLIGRWGGTTPSNQRSWQLYHLKESGNDRLQFSWSTDGKNQKNAIFNYPGIMRGAQHHIAIVRDGAYLRFFLDGSEHVSSPINIGNDFFFNGDNELFIGATKGHPNNVYHYKGHLDEIRITKGVARYAANFEPPTEQFPNFGPA